MVSSGTIGTPLASSMCKSIVVVVVVFVCREGRKNVVLVKELSTYACLSVVFMSSDSTSLLSLMKLP